MTNSLVKTAPLMQAVPAGTVQPLPNDDDVVTVPVGGAFGDVRMAYSQYMGVVRSALKSRIGKQLDKALAAHEAQQQAVKAASAK